MTFRARLLFIFLLAVLIPLIVLALFVRHEMTDRLTAQYERRVESLVSVIEADLAQESEKIAASLVALRGAVVDDNQFRRAAVGQTQDDRRYLLDYAGNAMRLAGLSMLQIQDETGRIISSGHFRNEYDRMEPELPKLLAAASGGIALVQARAPEAPFLALARVDSFEMGNRRFRIVAGVRVGRRFLDRLGRESEVTVLLVHPGGVLTPGASRDNPGDDTSWLSGDSPPVDEIVRVLAVPFIDPRRGEVSRATFHVTHRLTELRALRRSVDRWFLVAVVVAVVLSIMLVGWLASRISRPLVELADKTSHIDWERLDVDFDTGRKDEIGVLSRLLGAMTGRLRAGAIQIKDAERRATLGELARQVNHDIKNGLTPIRNVFRHLCELARNEPKRLPEVFEERRDTLDSSITYLENLAANYARLGPRSPRNEQEAQVCEVNEIVRRVVADLRGANSAVDLRAELSEGTAVYGDPVALRRVLENLVVNAIDSLESRAGTVAITTALHPGEDDGRRVRLTVADDGVGMNEEQRAKAFDDFYTTKENGTGLGLSIVRRLVMDLGGSISMESEKGKGSRFIVELPGTPARQ